ncbi:hypothetical protein TSMEX_000698 [Taenia solium]|eukprot:TsM_000725600 transcript=TsM_000725600 gene=TsM_000725600
MHLHQPKVAFITVQLQRLHRDSSITSSLSSSALLTPKNQILIILAISRTTSSPHNDEDVVSSCRRRKRHRRFFFCNLGALAYASLMLHHSQKPKSSNPLVVFIILLCLTSKATCLREGRSKFAAVAVPGQETGDLGFGETTNFCLDAEGERHGLFSSWRERSTGCQCSCQSVGNVLVSLCDDDCENNLNEDAEEGQSLLSQNEELFASLVHGDAPRRNVKVKPKAEKVPERTVCERFLRFLLSSSSDASPG